ncbi:hypothetical protein AB0K51_15880 [Kitasatospora sp. NPDC049285]|uniref:hypothetical protein n=1 Tax=Kitasatospora sp. NPDC049285 TaxID=3157096 RepID=UPI0034443BEE
MCRRVTCKSCGKATYAGCGMHVDQVLSGVPKAQRCSCAADTAATGSGSGSGSWLSRLFGRRGVAGGGTSSTR